MSKYRIHTTAGTDKIVEAANPIEAIKSLCPNEELNIKPFKKAEAVNNVNTIVFLLDGNRQSTSYYFVSAKEIAPLGKLIESEMYEVEYTYTDSPSYEKAKNIMQTLIDKGINITTPEFKREWVLAHNRREQAMWGDEDNAVTFNDFTLNERKALKDLVNLWQGLGHVFK